MHRYWTCIFFGYLPLVLVSDLLLKREGHAITLFANYSQISLQLCLSITLPWAVIWLSLMILLID